MTALTAARRKEIEAMVDPSSPDFWCNLPPSAQAAIRELLAEVERQRRMRMSGQPDDLPVAGTSATTPATSGGEVTYCTQTRTSPTSCRIEIQADDFVERLVNRLESAWRDGSSLGFEVEPGRVLWFRRDWSKP